MKVTAARFGGGEGGGSKQGKSERLQMSELRGFRNAFLYAAKADLHRLDRKLKSGESFQVRRVIYQP